MKEEYIAVEDFTKNLMETAYKGEHSSFNKINSIEEYRAAVALRSSIKKIIKGFKAAAKNCCHNYLICLNNGKDNVEYLFSYKKLRDCQEFYEEELELISESIKDYKNHLFIGNNLLSAVLGYNRKDYDD